MTKKFVIVIDAQFDFMMPTGKLYVTGAEKTIVPGITYLQGLTTEDTAGVLFTFDTHEENTYYDMPESKQFPIHCVRGTSGWQNVFNHKLVDPKVPTYALYKGVFNMWEEANVVIEDAELGDHHFHATREKFFNQLKADGIDTVVVMGVAADFCVKWAADGLVERGFKVEVPEALTAGIVRDINTVVADDFAYGAVTVV